MVTGTQAAERAEPALPTGTVTFLFTDVEGSTRLLHAHPEAYRRAIARHHRLLADAVAVNQGVVFETVGDAVYAAFVRPTDAVAAALWGQLALQSEDWGDTPVRVRMGLHHGEVELQGSHYFGAPLYRCARLMSTAHGGQVVLSEVMAALVRDAITRSPDGSPDGASLEDLGEHRLRDLARPEHVYQLVHPELPESFPPLRSLENHPNNLPVQLTPFVGRDGEIRALADRLTEPETRLLTVIGPGGAGKTRLALQVAAEVLDLFADGVYFVPLEPVRDGSLVGSAIAQALEVQEGGGRTLLDALKDYLREKQLLLVLDNFEQVASAAPLVADLLRTAPRLKVLVTSRAALRVSGEREFAVPPLAAPDPARLPSLERLRQYEAVQLFIQRAQDVRPDFAVSNENAPAVAEICHRLDGLPLAIELAAARTKLFPPQALLTRLEQGLAVLSGGARDLPARQQTLRNAIAWSYDLLSAGEQALFRRLAVFAGGCTIEAAEALWRETGDGSIDVVEVLDSLVDKSLLRQEETEGEPRFAMLETIREFALEQLATLGEASAAQGAHARLFLALAEQAAVELCGRNQVAWLRRMRRELDNPRAALRWSLAAEDPQALEVGLQLVVALREFWWMSANFSEGHRWATALLATLEPAKTPAVPAPLRAMAQWTAASLLWGHPSSLGLAEAALQTFRELGDAHGVARALHAMGDILGWQRHPARVAELAAEAAPIFRRVGDTRNFEKAIGLLGLAYEFAGHPARADAALAEAQSCAEAAGDVWAIGNAHSALANVAERRGDWAAAERYWQAALACYRALGSATQVRALFGLAVCATARGDLGTAAQRIGEALDEARNAGYPGGLARVLVYVGDLARVRGDLEAAHAHCAEAHEYVRRALDAFPQLGWWGASAARLGSLAAEAGDARAAREYLKESLELSVAPNLDDGLAYVLEELATLEASTVEPHRVLQLAGAAAALRRPGDQTRLFSADKERYQQRLDAARRRLSPDEAESAFAGGKALTREEAITLARSVLENAQQMTSALPRRDHIPSS